MQTLRVDIADFEAKALAETLPQTINGEKEYLVTERAGCQEQTPDFLNGNDVRQALGFRWFDQINMAPGLAQHMDIEEFKTMHIELDGTPGMRLQQIGEILEQLRFGQLIKLIIEYAPRRRMARE